MEVLQKKDCMFSEEGGMGEGCACVCACVCWKSGGGVAVPLFLRVCRMVLISILMEMVWDLVPLIYL